MSEQQQQIYEDYQWYVVHTHSGKEFAAKKSLDKQRLDKNFSKVKDVIVPVYKEIVYKDGKKRQMEKKSFPGYMYVQMCLDKEAISFVTSTPYVSSFVCQGDDTPRPLSEQEIKSVINEKLEEGEELTPVQIDFDIGQKVLIIDGPFNNFSGTIKDIYPDKRKVCVNIEIFGRITPVEIDYFKVKKN